MYNKEVERQIEKLLSEPRHEFNLKNVTRLSSVMQLMTEYNPSQDRTIATTFRHSYRMAEMAAELGKRMGLDGKTQNALACAGLLHDIGKTAVPEELLYKQGRYTEEERNMVKGHDEASERILNAYFKKVPDEVMQAVKHHHRGECDKNIGIRQRDKIQQFIGIMRAADQLEALESNDRTYNKEPRTIKESVRLLKENAVKKGEEIPKECLHAAIKLAVNVDRRGIFDECGNISLGTMQLAIRESLIAEAEKAGYEADVILKDRGEISCTENHRDSEIGHIQDKEPIGEKGTFMAGSFRVHGPNHVERGEDEAEFRAKINQFCEIERFVKNAAENVKHSSGEPLNFELKFSCLDSPDIMVAMKNGDYDIGVYDEQRDIFRRDISNKEFNTMHDNQKIICEKIRGAFTYDLKCEKNIGLAPVHNEKRYHELHNMNNQKIRIMPYKKEYDDLYTR